MLWHLLQVSQECFGVERQLLLLIYFVGKALFLQDTLVFQVFFVVICTFAGSCDFE
jgi:hypothetical protein